MLGRGSATARVLVFWCKQRVVVIRVDALVFTGFCCRRASRQVQLAALNVTTGSTQFWQAFVLPTLLWLLIFDKRGCQDRDVTRDEFQA